MGMSKGYVLDGMAVACQISCSLLSIQHQATGLPCVSSNPADQKLLYTPQPQGKTSELHSAPSAGLFALPLGAFPLASGSLPISKWGPSYQLVGAIPRHSHRPSQSWDSIQGL